MYISTLTILQVLDMVRTKQSSQTQSAACSSEASTSANVSSLRHRPAALEALGRSTVATVKQFKLPPVIHRRLFELYNSQVNALWFEDLIADGGITVKAAAALVRAMHEDLDMMFDETLCIQNVSQ